MSAARLGGTARHRTVPAPGRPAAQPSPPSHSTWPAPRSCSAARRRRRRQPLRVARRRTTPRWPAVASLGCTLTKPLPPGCRSLPPAGPVGTAPLPQHLCLSSSGRGRACTAVAGATDDQAGGEDGGEGHIQGSPHPRIRRIPRGCRARCTVVIRELRGLRGRVQRIVRLQRIEPHADRGGVGGVGGGCGRTAGILRGRGGGLRGPVLHSRPGGEVGGWERRGGQSAGICWGGAEAVVEGGEVRTAARWRVLGSESLLDDRSDDPDRCRCSGGRASAPPPLLQPSESTDDARWRVASGEFERCSKTPEHTRLTLSSGLR